MVLYSESAMERAMKMQEAIVRAIAKKITWARSIGECLVGSVTLSTIKSTKPAALRFDTPTRGYRVHKPVFAVIA